MTVLFDITVLGVGHSTEKARTGVFRVIENLAEQLVLHPGCDVKFFSNLDRINLEHSVDYWKASPALSSTPFSIPPLCTFRKKITQQKYALIEQLINGPRMPLWKKTKTRIQIKRYQALERFCHLYYADLMERKDKTGVDIYHSPFYALPDKIHNGAYKSIFITCYDLIPFLFPEYFEPYIIETIHSLLRSVNRETWILCISESTRNDLLNQMGGKISPERVIVTELAASEKFYRSLDKDNNLTIRRKHHIPDAPYVLSLCTFEPRKNIEQAIKAFARMISQENIPDLFLVLVGNKGWMFDKIFDEIENRSALKRRIVVTGFIPDEDLAAIYSDALFFVYPSFYEGFGLPPLEAMKCGTPVITSNTSSLPEVVGDAGIMVPPTDLDELCQAMLSVYKSPSLQKQMAVKSLERAGMFSWKRCADQTVDAYKASLQ